jgi:hypothetical protein
MPGMISLPGFRYNLTHNPPGAPMPQEIHVLIEADGSVKIDALGFAGADCEQATAFLEKALGTVQQKRRKPEYFLRARNAQRQGLRR